MHLGIKGIFEVVQVRNSWLDLWEDVATGVSLFQRHLPRHCQCHTDAKLEAQHLAEAARMCHSGFSVTL